MSTANVAVLYSTYILIGLYKCVFDILTKALKTVRGDF